MEKFTKVLNFLALERLNMRHWHIYAEIDYLPNLDLIDIDNITDTEMQQIWDDDNRGDKVAISITDNVNLYLWSNVDKRNIHKKIHEDNLVILELIKKTIDFKK